MKVKQFEERLEDENGQVFIRSYKRLGRGAYAEVFLGRRLPPGAEPNEEPPDAEAAREELVAIKRFMLNKQTLDRVLDTEIHIMRSLDHKNIVKMISVITHRLVHTGDGDTDGTDETDRLYIILEYCAGGDFRSFIKRKRLSEKWACFYLKQIACGLRYLRERNVVHRDLKPHNMLLSRDKRTLKIADFGFARIMGSEALEATLVGTPYYMAPEVLYGERYCSKADLWSVGVILYEMLCGKPPFADARELDRLRQQIRQRPVTLPMRVRVTVRGRELLSGLLRKDSARRMDWDEFFEHPWFDTDWDQLKRERAAASSASASTTSATSASTSSASTSTSATSASSATSTTSTTIKGVPPSSAPRPITRTNAASSGAGGFRLTPINNYLEQFHHSTRSAPTRSAPNLMSCARSPRYHHPSFSLSPPSAGSTSIPSSMFGSGRTFSDRSREYQSATQSAFAGDSTESGGRQSDNQSSFRKNVKDFVSTGFSLLRDSMNT